MLCGKLVLLYSHSVNRWSFHPLFFLVLVVFILFKTRFISLTNYSLNEETCDSPFPWISLIVSEDEYSLVCLLCILICEWCMDIFCTYLLGSWSFSYRFAHTVHISLTCLFQTFPPIPFELWLFVKHTIMFSCLPKSFDIFFLSIISELDLPSQLHFTPCRVHNSCPYSSLFLAIIL